MGSPIDPTRLYLRTPAGCTRILWFHNNRPNEMLMGIAGLSSKGVTLAYEFPEYLVGDDKLHAIRYNWSHKINVDLPFDHITCHQDGKFHLKVKSGERYVHELRAALPLNADSPIFLQFMIVSDRACEYSALTPDMKIPSACIDVEPTQFIVLRGAFSGTNFDLQGNMAQLLAKLGRSVAPGVCLTSSTIQGCFIFDLKNSDPEMFKNHPGGTIASFLFPTQDGYLIKTFVFK